MTLNAGIVVAALVVIAIAVVALARAALQVARTSEPNDDGDGHDG
jgi:hypothetical protein